MVLAAESQGDSAGRQPVQTVYGGAQLFKAETPARLGANALELIRTYTPDAASFAQCLGLAGGEFATSVFDRTVEKLGREPVEDFRIDFEDGYGYRSEEEEDGHAQSTARALARAQALPGFPPFIGIRIKPFTVALRARAKRTLDLFFQALCSETIQLPDNFVVTLPKISVPEQVAELVETLQRLELRHGLQPGILRIELMIETPQAIIDPFGAFGIPRLIEAAGGRCRGLHFGPYDYTASCDIATAEQRLDHPACDFARNVIQVSAAGRGVNLSDGPSTILPIPRHRASPGVALTSEQAAENRTIVHRAMRHHFDLVQRSLANGYYQGWDLHPGQLPTRYAAVYAFFLKSLDSTSARLRNFIDQAARATLVGDVFDDAATGQGLLNFLLRGVNCGAFSVEEAGATGLTIEELRGRSFSKIMDNRARSVI
ncbi:MAG: phosphoenolpyruvate kinase [Bryobacteraceae bacterium]